MDTEREQRMEALRARVKAKKEAALAGEVEEELVVSTAEIESATTEAEDEWYAMIDRDADRWSCLLYTSPSPRDLSTSRMPSSA